MVAYVPFTPLMSIVNCSNSPFASKSFDSTTPLSKINLPFFKFRLELVFNAGFTVGDDVMAMIPFIASPF